MKMLNSLTGIPFHSVQQIKIASHDNMKPKTNAHKSHKKQSGHNNNPQSGKSAAKSDLAIVKQPKRRPSDSKNDEEDIDNPNSGFAEYLKSGTGN